MLATVLVIALAAVAGSGGSRAHARSSPARAPAAGSRSDGSRTTSATAASPGASAFTPDPRAVTIANRLRLPEQVAQLFLVSVDGQSPSTAKAGLGATGWGGVVLDSSNDASPSQLGALAGAIVSSAKAAGLPAPLIAAAQAGGPGTAFPGLPPEPEPVTGASGRPSEARAQALLAAQRLLPLHVTMTIAPLADVDIPSGALSGRLFGQDPGTVAQFSAAAVSGYAAGGLIAAAGHFPGSGAASADPDQMTATVGGPLAQLRGHDLLPFAAIARTVPVIVMSNAAYAAFDGVTPASLLPQAVNLLREDYHFAGVVMSDDLDAALQPTGSSPGAVALEALHAGDDLLYITGPPSEHAAAYAGVLAAAQRSASARAEVRQALLRDLTLKLHFHIIRG